MNKKVYLLWAKHFECANAMLIGVYNSEKLAEEEAERYRYLHDTYAVKVITENVHKNPII